jgi:periplasmic protein TonB
MASFNPPGTSRIGMLAAIALHATAAVAVFNVVTIPPQPAPSAAPIIVSMITAPVPEPVRPEPVVEIPKPQPVVKPPEPVKKQLLVAEKPAVEPAAAAPAPPPVVEASPPPTAAAPAQASVAAPTEPAPVAPIPPSFDAAYLNNPAPAYPSMSKRMEEQGTVILHVFVNADGSAGTVELHTSSGAARLDQAALDTVKRWRFSPAKQGAQALAAWVLVPISFSL